MALLSVKVATASSSAASLCGALMLRESNMFADMKRVTSPANNQPLYETTAPWNRQSEVSG